MCRVVWRSVLVIVDFPRADAKCQQLVITRQTDSRTIWAGLGVAAVLHLALILGSRAYVPFENERTPSASGLVVLLELEATEVVTAAVTQESTARSGSLEPWPPKGASQERSVRSSARDANAIASSARVEHRPEAVASGPSEPGPLAGLEQPRKLSLAALGMGTSWSRSVLEPIPNGATDSPIPHEAGGRGSGSGAEIQRAEARLDASLRAALGARDQALSLGPEGPFIEALTTLTLASPIATASSAMFSVHVNSQGQVHLVELMEASGDTRGWEDIRRRLLEQFAHRRVRVTAHGETLQLAVVSSEELPSGASPGLDLDLAGLKLTRGRGPRSTQLSLLTPKVLALPFAEDPDGVKLPVVSFGIAGSGDPTDLASTARRVVRARLTQLVVH